MCIACVCARVHLCCAICMCMYVYCMSVRVCTSVLCCMCVCMYVCVYVCTSLLCYMCIYAHVLAQVYIYIHEPYECRQIYIYIYNIYIYSSKMAEQQIRAMGATFLPRNVKRRYQPTPEDLNDPDVRYCFMCTGEFHSLYFSKSVQYFGCNCRLFCNICVKTIYRKSHHYVLWHCSAKTPDGQVKGCNNCRKCRIKHDARMSCT